MPVNLTKTQIYESLGQIKHPEMQRHNLVQLGMIPEVNFEKDQIHVTLALPSLDAPIRQKLIETIQHSIEKLSGGLKTDVRVVIMNETQLAHFHSAVREELKVAPQTGVHVRRVLAVISGKGGVGKSSVAGLLASSLRKRDFKVGVLDADITGPSIPKMFGNRQLPEGGPEGIEPIISLTGIKLMSINFLLPDENQPLVWRGPLISKAIQQFWSDISWGDLDVLVVDLPPGTSDASLTVMQSLPLDGIILVTSPQDLAGMVVRKAANMAASLGVKIVGLVENMSYLICPECGAKIDLFGPSRAADTAQWIGTKLLGQIPLDPKLSILCDEGAIEKYVSPAFELVTNQVLELAEIHEPDSMR